MRTNLSVWLLAAGLVAGVWGTGASAGDPVPLDQRHFGAVALNDHGGCITPAQRARIEAQVAAHRSVARSRRLARRAARAAAAGGVGATAIEDLETYAFHPQGGTLYQDLFPNNFVDLNPGNGISDWDGTDWTFDGHTGCDTAVRSFSDEDIGVPVFSALDGTVVDKADGNSDHNTRNANVPANYLVIDNGADQYCIYYHLRKGSMPFSVDDDVSAGQQIGLTGSSGNSSYPHLHFETRDGYTVVEPYAGRNRPGPSLWDNQVPIRRETYVRDFNLSSVNPGSQPGLPVDIPRDGTYVQGTRSVAVWSIIHNVPARGRWQIKFRRPDGSVRLDSGANGFGNSQIQRWGWYWWRYDVNLNSAGTWTVELYVNGNKVAGGPLTVVANASQAVNHAPGGVTAAFDPAEPTGGETVFCRIPMPAFGLDPDYDVVRYRYVWTVDGEVVRDTTTTALSDALSYTDLSGATDLVCTVTPSDGKLDGPTFTLHKALGPSISGRITNGAGAAIPGVTVATNGATSVTAADGSYTLAGITTGQHVVTPVKAGYTFTPATRTVTLFNQLGGIDFTGRAGGAIRGRVTAGGIGVPNVTLTAGGATVVTDSTGAYELAGLATGSYALTPSLAGSVFQPPFRSITLGATDIIGMDFATDGYRVSGTVLRDGAPAAGVAVSAAGQTAQTDATGLFVFPVLPPGTWPVTPVSAGLTFTPAARTVTLGPAHSDVNFTVAASGFSVSGVIANAGEGVPGIQVTAGSLSAITQADGSYRIEGLPAGTYTVTPSKGGFSFIPPNRTVTLGPSVTSAHFSAAQVPILTWLAFKKNPVHSGKPANGQFNFDRPTQGTTVVMLTSSRPDLVPVPVGGVKVPKGTSNARFALKTRGAAANTSVTITATCNGSSVHTTLVLTAN